MLREFIWKTFEDTGEVDLYMFYREIEGKRRGLNESSMAADEVATSDSFHNSLTV